VADFDQKGDRIRVGSTARGRRPGCLIMSAIGGAIVGVILHFILCTMRYGEDFRPILTWPGWPWSSMYLWGAVGALVFLARAYRRQRRAAQLEAAMQAAARLMNFT
jgi:hypothetical protein